MNSKFSISSVAQYFRSMMHNFLYIGLKLKDVSKCFNRALHAQRLDLRNMNTLVLVGITICYTRTEYLKTCKQNFKRRLHILHTGTLISSASLINKHEKKKREREPCAPTATMIPTFYIASLRFQKMQ